MSMSVDGLVSGLNTTDLINQLMQAERQPQVNLQNKKSQISSSVDVYRALNTKLQAIQDAAGSLATASGWQAVKATSSDETVATVAAGLSASPAALAFHVTALAAAHAVITPTFADPAATGQITGPVTITGSSGSTVIGSVGDGSLNAVAAAINTSTANVTATVVHLADGSYSMQLVSKTSGAAGQFSVTGLESLGSMQVLTQGADAKITVGDPNAVHYDVSSATNSFDSLLSGTTITVKKLGDASVNVTADPGAIADKIDSLVKAVNDTVGSIKAQSSYNSATKQAGALLGDLASSRISQSLTSAIIDAVGGSAISAGAVGLSVDRDGTLSFDRSKFLDQYSKDPTSVAKVFQAGDTTTTADDGVAERLRTVASSATDSLSGTITLAIQSRTDEMKQLDDAISDWDNRLSQKQDNLKRMFSSMEVALSQLRNQSSWLAGQIAKL